MTGRGNSALLMAVVAVVAVVSAPPANARPYCHLELERPANRTGGTTICQTDGRVSIKTRPGITTPRF